jgi:hypothetical protein
MKRISLAVLLVCLLAGCEALDTESESQYDKVSREIERLKAQSAAEAEGNVKVVVNMLSVEATDYSAFDVIWQYVDRNVAVAKRPEVFAPSGLKVGLASDNFRIQLNIVKKNVKSSEESELFLMVSDGIPGYINVGTEISVPRFYHIGRWYSSVDYEFRQAGRSLEVVAHRLPDGLVEMQLTPVFSKFLNDGGALKLAELTTTIIARSGQAVVIGGGSSGGENVASALFARSKRVGKSQTLVTVTPYLQ